MCPDAVGVSKKFQTRLYTAAVQAAVTQSVVKSETKRVFIRFTLAAVPPLAANEAYINIYSAYDSSFVAVGRCTPSRPTVELSFERHGQLVYGPFGFDDATGTIATVHISDAIVTENMERQ